MQGKLSCKILYITYNSIADAMSEMMCIMAIINIPPATERPQGMRESKGGWQSTPVLIALMFAHHSA